MIIDLIIVGLCIGESLHLTIRVPADRALEIVVEDVGFRFRQALVRFGKDPENRYIPRVSGDFIHPLALESNAYQLRPQPVMSAAKECEVAIEETASHADAVTLIVEGDERSHDNIETTRVDRHARYRLPKTEPIQREFRLWQCFMERHLPMRRDYGEENALSCAPCAFDDCTCIYFIPGRDVATYRVAGQKVAAVEKSIGDAP